MLKLTLLEKVKKPLAVLAAGTIAFSGLATSAFAAGEANAASTEPGSAVNNITTSTFNTDLSPGVAGANVSRVVDAALPKGTAAKYGSVSTAPAKALNFLPIVPFAENDGSLLDDIAQSSSYDGARDEAPTIQQLMSPPVLFDDGGSGSIGGAGLPGATGLGVDQRWYDNPQVGKQGAARFPQGEGANSIEWFLSRSGIPRGSTMWGNIGNACNIAIADANGRVPAGQMPAGETSRVVGIMWAFTGNDPTSGYDASVGAQRFRGNTVTGENGALQNWLNTGAPGFYGESRNPDIVWAGVKQPGYDFAGKLVKDELASNGNGENPGSWVSAVCVAFNPLEPEPDPSYNLIIATQAQNTFTLPGGTQPVFDYVSASKPSSAPTEKLITAKVTLNWDGYGDNAVSSGNAVKLKTKDCVINNYQANQCSSTTFVPSDLGMTEWQAGRYWYNVSVAKQQNMEAAVSHGDRATVSERWTASGYTPNFATTAQSTFTLPGGTATVNDKIVGTNNANGNLSEDVAATITLNWDGFPSNNTVSKSSAKSVTVKTGGAVTSPDFEPSDLGMTEWQAGRYWYKLEVPKAKNMASAFISPDRESSETWESKGYTLNVATQHQAPSSLKAGSTTPVGDQVTASNNGGNGGLVENLTATVTMHWDGFPVGNPATSQKNASKTFTMTSKGNTATPTFTPSDFGWNDWPAGQFWFGIDVARQGSMAAAYTSPQRDTGEVFELSPTPPEKVLTDMNGNELTKDQVAAAQMPFFAKIVAYANGASKFSIIDHVSATKDTLTLGDNGKVTNDTVYVVGPDGKKVNDATITIADGKVKGKDGKETDGQIVTAVIGSATSTGYLGAYTLMVKSTPNPSHGQFTMFDYPQVCWHAPGDINVCEGDPSTGVDLEKFPPDPNKVWALDREGALVAVDPDKTNNQGADQMTFVPGDSVSAVVNGSVKEGLFSNLEQYQIADDWTGAAKYVDFTYPGKAEVLVQWPGMQANQWNTITDQFNIQVINGTGGKYQTIATAKANSDFLSRTGGLVSDAKVKLIINGTFKPETDTDGKKEKLTNGGWEMWNNDKVETNIPPVFIQTPKPNKVWAATPEGALEYTDPDWTNNEGSDNKYFVPGDDVWATVNGKIPESMAKLDGYVIEDLYEESADFINFDKSSVANGRIKVYYDARVKKTDPVKFEDVTNLFSITNSDNKIIATGKIDFFKKVNEQLAATNPPFDREVRLITKGTIFDDIMEKGDEDVEMKNSGREQWNHTGKYTNTPSIFSRIPEPNKSWALDEEGALVATDPDWTNETGADGKTFVPGDSISAVVNGTIPAKLAAPFKEYSLTDDWSDALKYVDFSDASKVKVYFGGEDVTNQFTITVDKSKGITKAKALPTFLARTGNLAADVPTKLIITGNFILDIDTDGKEIEMVNAGSETWNNKTEETNKPPVFIRTPKPTKCWVLDETGALAPSSDAGCVDDNTFVPGDEIGAVANGILPKNLGANLVSYVLTDDWSDGLKFVKLDKAKVFIDGKDATSSFDIKIDLAKGITTATAKKSLLDTTANQLKDRQVKLHVWGELLLDPADNCTALGTSANQGKGCALKNKVSETWNNKTVEGNEPGIFVRVPDPNKVWVLDKDGALVANDPNWTNNEGVDNQVFLHGDEVGAVVNGVLPKNLAVDLSNYQIRDDWSDSAKYVDFSNIDKDHVFVYVDGVDRTKDFDITLNGTVTEATAKPVLLKGTAKQAKDRVVKLILIGEFREWSEATDTGGKTIKLTNAGSETWNKQTKPTNKPPVFIWNPDPDKDVLGSKDQDGDQESINGQMVFPGQIIQYEVLLDTTLPEGMAYDVSKFGMVDYYDPLFIPNKQSLTVTGRDGIIPASKYKVTWDDDNHKFDLFFDQAWITDYLKFYEYQKPGEANTGQDGRRYIAVNFDGKVSTDALPGQEIINKAVQIINNSKVPTPEPEVTVPPTEPDKEDLKCTVNAETGLYENCDDIDGKTVMLGDKIDYRLTLDARPAASKIAYRVHKLGMVDHYDNEYLNIDTKDIKVVVASVGSDNADRFAVGQNVTDMVNIQVDKEDGEAYIFFKTVDTTLNTTGEVIPGDPQPADLAAYNEAPIDPLKDAGIDQDVLGNTYYIYLRGTVIKEVNDYTIYNQATQNFENMNTVTKVVSNPLKELKPEKDVTVEVDGESVNGKEIPLYSSFNYLLKSSIIPANRAYESSQWSIVDKYDTAHDRYLDQYLVRTQTDIYNDKDLIAKAGDTIAVSDSMICVDEAMTKPLEKDGAQSGGDTDSDKSCYEREDLPFQDSFTVEDKDGVLTVTALKDSYFDTINTRLDLEQGWMIWTQFERIAPGESITNIFTEYYNDIPREPEEVVTKTPEHPAISIVKYDIKSGIKDGDRNTQKDALLIKGKDKVEIGFLITNTGDVPLKNIVLDDKTIAGSGTVTDITCEPKLDGLVLQMKDTVLCKGMLSGVKEGETHTDKATVTGESIFTGKKVSDDDPWNGKTSPLTNPTGTDGTVLVIVVGSALLVAGAGAAYIGLRGRSKRNNS